MAAPRLSWYSQDNTQQVTNFDLGVVDAGTTSQEFTFLLWNNRRLQGQIDPSTTKEYGETDVSDVEDLTITTKDTTGGTNSEVVLGQWLQVNAPDKDGEGNFFPVGFNQGLTQDVRHPVWSTGTTTYTHQGDGAPTVSTPEVAPHVSANGRVCLLGVANDGTLANSKGNNVKLVFRAAIPGNATAGVKNFLTRASYKFV